MITQYFTFGFDHIDPNTNESLSNKYVVITSPNKNVARNIMFHFYGDKWAFQYDDLNDFKNVLYCHKEINMRFQEEVLTKKLFIPNICEYVISKFYDIFYLNGEEVTEEHLKELGINTKF